MPKKMFDILPPKMVRKVEKNIKEFLEDGKGKKSKNKRKKDRKFLLKGILAGVCVLILIAGVYFYFKLQRADVEITMKTETLSFNNKVIADKSQSAVDVEKNIIPAEYIEEEKDLWQEFPATGDTANTGKASGTITVYNKYTPATVISLKAGTHFLSDSEKYFVSLDKISIPAAKIQAGKIIPGSVKVKVSAAEPGEEYNIKPAKFSVPKLSGTSYYYGVYAESTDPMAGGFSKPMKQVIAEDIQNAKSSLTKKLFDDAVSSLKNKISSDSVLLEDYITKNVVDASSSVKSGAVIDKFNEQVKVKVSALVFKKSDMQKFAKAYMLSQMENSRAFLDDSLSLDYSAESADLKEGKISINLKFSGKDYFSVDKNDLISLFRQKKAEQIKEIIDNNLGDQVSEIKINLRPFWTIKAPNDANKIKFDLKFE